MAGTRIIHLEPLGRMGPTNFPQSKRWLHQIDEGHRSRLVAQVHETLPTLPKEASSDGLQLLWRPGPPTHAAAQPARQILVEAFPRFAAVMVQGKRTGCGQCSTLVV